ncbi:polysaccharide biosynthesis tyrosine autokinase [Planobispora longispora]|uniref:Polysaccharide chain length determinant N-terminal domain-containing protein n=1 Tax=Planobispora longispora TaxID=28887 RepID=A0A8J3RJS6_9ACTN|nr:polysaccharide biosynthesis tyrosine autokinase [Planobispora longispora]GIH76229.1 hypothetical protein Plo01_26580 [Planobispora longispora]
MDQVSSMPRADVTEVADYAALLGRRWWIIAVSAMLGVAMSALAVVYLPEVYTAEATVLVTATDSNTRDDQVNLETEAGRVRSAEVVGKVRQTLKSGEDPVDLVERLSVTAPQDSGLLEISFQDSTPARASEGANAFATVYLNTRRARVEQRYKQQILALQGQIKSLSEQLKAVPTSNSGQRQYLNGQLQSFSAKLADIQIEAVGVSVGEVIDKATSPEAPTFPRPIMFLPAGLLVGLILGIMAAVLADRSDKQVRAATDLRRVLGVETLLDLPSNPKTVTLGLESARGRVGQRFHELSHGITARLGGGPANQVVLVTGAAEGRGTAVVAANIAAALARTGSDVMLVNADLGSSVSGDLLGVPAASGLAEVLLGTSTLAEAEARAAVPPSLRVIPRGKETDQVIDMIQGERMARVIDSLRDRCRYIVIEAPATTSGADAQALAQHADLALMVVEVPKTRYAEISDGIRQLEQVGAEVLGAVVIPWQAPAAPAAVPAAAAAPAAETVSSRRQEDVRVAGASDEDMKGLVGADEDGLGTAMLPVIKDEPLGFLK